MINDNSLGSERAVFGFIISNTSFHETSAEMASKEQKIGDRDAEEFVIRPDVVSLAIGDQVKLRAVAVPTENQKLPNDPQVVWESSNPEVAFFTNGDVLNAATEGLVTIKATNVESLEEVTVQVEVMTLDDWNNTDPILSWSVNTITVAFGSTPTYPTLTNESGVVVSYSSSNPEVATIDSTTGELTLLKSGETIITATSEKTSDYNSIEVSYTLTINKGQSTVAWSSETYTATFGDTYEFPTLIHSPETLTPSYSSSNTSVATVSESGEITVLAGGESTITATIEGDDCWLGSSSSVAITINKLDPNISWSSNSAEVTLGDAYSFPTLSNPNGLEVSYSSSDTGVASINPSGVIAVLDAGETTISATFAGSSTYNSVTVSFDLVVNSAPAIDYSQEYFFITAVSSGTLVPRADGTLPEVYYSIDKETWEIFDTTLSVSPGDNIYFKANLIGNVGSNGNTRFLENDINSEPGISTAKFNVSGNILSLLFSDNYLTETIGEEDYFTFWEFFDNLGVVDASNLILPNITIRYCYGWMFKDCKDLVSAPVLPASVLEEGCYYEMFAGSSNLSSVSCLATDISASDCTSGWLWGVSETGTFTKAASMSSWTTGDSGIPSGWTTVDDQS